MSAYGRRHGVRRLGCLTPDLTEREFAKNTEFADFALLQNKLNPDITGPHE